MQLDEWMRVQSFCTSICKHLWLDSPSFSSPEGAIHPQPRDRSMKSIFLSCFLPLKWHLGRKHIWLFAQDKMHATRRGWWMRLRAMFLTGLTEECYQTAIFQACSWKEYLSFTANPHQSCMSKYVPANMQNTHQLLLITIALHATEVAVFVTLITER